jgi:hypothetical protein
MHSKSGKLWKRWSQEMIENHPRPDEPLNTFRESRKHVNHDFGGNLLENISKFDLIGFPPGSQHRNTKRTQ